ncbi:MAG TPA: N-acetylneuraminate synthase family protein [Vicinamibacterales bacterium]|nr:N-acetylneuraminate synthase family protein [Vicinamibacterales bacterium]
MSLRIGDRLVGSGEPPYVIAEAGSNHNRDFGTALALIDAAAEAGADAVKFQTFTADALVARTSDPIATLTDEFSKYGRTVHEMFAAAEMPLEWLAKLKDHATGRGITFLSTPFDERSADVLADLDMPAYKVASYEVVHLPLIRHIARKGKPVLISTGMASLGEIEEAIGAVRAEGNDQIAIFHCPIGYPVPPEHVNLAVLDTLRQVFDIPVGLSDHTRGIAVPVAAVARGASLIEKHYTLDAGQAGPDHGFAIEPHELAGLVAGCREAFIAIGDGRKVCLPSEQLHYVRGRRSLFAAVPIPAGTVVTEDMLAILRPGTGLAPRFREAIVGRRARRDISAFDPIRWDDV